MKENKRPVCKSHKQLYEIERVSLIIFIFVLIALIYFYILIAKKRILIKHKTMNEKI